MPLYKLANRSPFFGSFVVSYPFEFVTSFGSDSHPGAFARISILITGLQFSNIAFAMVEWSAIPNTFLNAIKLCFFLYCLHLNRYMRSILCGLSNHYALKTMNGVNMVKSSKRFIFFLERKYAVKICTEESVYRRKHSQLNQQYFVNFGLTILSKFAFPIILHNSKTRTNIDFSMLTHVIFIIVVVFLLLVTSIENIDYGSNRLTSSLRPT